MTNRDETLWQVVDSLESRVPFNELNVRDALGEVLPIAQSGYAPFVFLVGGPVALNDGCIVKKIDLRVARDRRSSSSFLVLEIEGAPVSFAQVKKRYSNLEVTDSPRGHSLEEQTSFSTHKKWGRLSSGFTERHPDNLASIVFNPVD